MYQKGQGNNGYSNYNIQEATRKLAVSTAFRSLYLKNPDRPDEEEKMRGLAIAVALFLELDKADINRFIAMLQDYVDMRYGTKSVFRKPVSYE
jgi:ABC-type microcin C transport system permease subunit YejB